MSHWYARPVLCVADIERTLGFYTEQLGFTEAWRYAEDGKAMVAQADREGCALIFSAQWPERAGSGLMFLSLDPPVLEAVRTELEARGVPVTDGHWGYPVMIVTDPDGNRLFFAYPNPPEA